MSAIALKRKLAQPDRATALAFVALASAFITLAGCSQRTSDYSRYVPSEAVAREALDAALAAWKRGDPVGPLKIASAPVSIQVSDSQRSAGNQLADYEIVGEIAGEGPRSFSVRLVLDQPRREQRVRYYLVGIDPLWVFQQRDYDGIVHWEACDDEQPVGSQVETAAATR